jgi:hypothetical protein
MNALSNIQFLDDRNQLSLKLYPGHAWWVLRDTLANAAGLALPLVPHEDFAISASVIPQLVPKVAEIQRQLVSRMAPVQLPKAQLLRRVIEGSEVFLYLRLESHAHVDGIFKLQSALEDAVSAGSGLRALLVPELDSLAYRVAQLLKAQRELSRAELKEAIVAEYARLTALSPARREEDEAHVARLDEPAVLDHALALLEGWRLLARSDGGSTLVATDKLGLIRL